jgi:hypothetical protein
MSKLDFIIPTYEDGPIRVEKTNTLLKTYTHRCELPVREAWQSQYEIGFANTFSNPLGWITRLASPTHSPTLWVG